VIDVGEDEEGRFQTVGRKPGIGSTFGTLWLLSLFFMVPSCKPGDTAAPTGSPPHAEANQLRASTPSGTPGRSEKIWTDFDGSRVLAEAKTISDFGPRPSGSDASKKVRQHLTDLLKSLGWQTTEQRLTEQAPDGREVEFCNLIARFSNSPASPQRIIIGAHFDTSASQEYRDAGASDGAANTAVLIELARTLAQDPQLAGNVELLFLDGSAPFREVTLNDGLFGSRFYTQMLRINQHIGDIRAAILLNNVGGATLNYLPNSDPNLVGTLKNAATALGIKLESANRSLLADHIPFAQAGIRSVTLLDVNSPFLNTADDTADRLDGGSLTKTGSLILYFAATERGSQ
jgi:glutaminyl-peptide cyclotransferase